jgi:hypothetical protein
MKKMFYKYCSKEILVKRNRILKIIHITLLSLTLISGLLLKFDVLNSLELKVFFITMLLISIRYEFWYTWYWVDTSCEDGYKFYRNTGMQYQRKLFTFVLHKDGEANPLL